MTLDLVSTMDPPDGIPSEDLPFGVENHSLNRFRAKSRSQSREPLPADKAAPPPAPLYFEDFIAAELARDKQRGVIGSPIAPSSISDISAAQKRWLRRYRKLWWVYVTIALLALGSTIVGIVYIVQGRRYGIRAGHLIWLLLSVTGVNGACALLWVLHIRRSDRRDKEKAWAKLEVEKYKRDMEKNQKETDRASAIANRLSREFRSASRAASLRSEGARSERKSRSRSGSRSRNAELAEIGEAGQTFLNYQELYNSPSSGKQPVVPETNDAGSTVLNSQEVYNFLNTENPQEMPQTNEAGSTFLNYQELYSSPSAVKQRGQNMSPRDDSETLVGQISGSPPSVPLPETGSSSPPTKVSADHGPTSLDQRIVADSIGGDNDIVRAGHGGGGSDQSDDNFRQMHELDSDAASDDSDMAERRRGRSRERVEPWQRQQLEEPRFEDPNTPAKAPKVDRADDGRSP